MAKAPEEQDNALALPAPKKRALRALVNIHHKKPVTKGDGGEVIDPPVDVIKKGTVIAEGALPKQDQDRLVKNGHLAFEPDPAEPITDLQAGAEAGDES